MKAQSRSLFDWNIVGPAIGDAFKKLNPRLMVKNPVMFVTMVGAALTTVGIFTASPICARLCSANSRSGSGSRCCSPLAEAMLKAAESPGGQPAAGAQRNDGASPAEWPRGKSSSAHLAKRRPRGLRSRRHHSCRRRLIEGSRASMKPRSPANLRRSSAERRRSQRGYWRNPC